MSAFSDLHLGKRRTGSFLGATLLLSVCSWQPIASAEDAPAGEGAESVVQLALADVVEQLRDATTQMSSGWASQPGAVRLFGTDGTTHQIFKLYSSDEFVVNTAAEAVDDVPDTWDDRPSQFVDLNAPLVGEGFVHFPIADPRAYTGARRSSAEGFSYSDPIPGIVPPLGNPDNQRLPMPVRWLYVLEDGTCGYLGDDNRFVGDTTPSSDNPIVARYAYWTDDESCKINVNTASEAAHWDMPRADTPQERRYAEFQPAGKEYQRIPGHPATVCLSSVLFPGSRYPESLTLTEAKQLWKLTPEVSADGGSEGGTRRLEHRDDTLSHDDPPHANLEDFINHPALPERARQRTARSRFLLTTDNESPAQNVHGLPRVLTWPVYDAGISRFGRPPNFTPSHSASDRRMIELGTSLYGADKYYIQRDDPATRHQEFYNRARGENQRLSGYIKGMTERPIAGFGTSIADKYGTAPDSERDAIVNLAMDYLRISNTDDPSINRAYTYNRINRDNRDNDSGWGQVAPTCLCGGTNSHRSLWHSNLPHGTGRSYVVTEVALVFMARAVHSESGFQIGRDARLLGAGTKLLEVGLVVEVFSPAHGYSTITPNMGITIGGPTVGDEAGLTLPTYRINEFEFGDFPNRSLHAWIDDSGEFVGLRPWGGHGGTRLFSTQPADDPNFPDHGFFWEEPLIFDAGMAEPFFRNTIQETQTLMTFTGSPDPLAVRLYDHSHNQLFGNFIQEYLIKFAHPQIAGQPITLPTPSIDSSKPNTWRWKDRVKAAIRDPDILIQPGDVVRSVVLRHGDARVAAGKRLLDADSFVAHPDFADRNKRHAHSLTMADGSKHVGYSSGRDFIPTARYPRAKEPDFPISPAEADFAAPSPPTYPFSMDPAVTGDWDNGLGAHLDGSFINYPNGMPFIWGDDLLWFDRLGNQDPSDGTHDSPFFSAKRAIPSPGTFGSLPTGVQSNIPWRTLLFRPDTQHYGASEAPDHLWMDLFRMPTVDPEGISDRWAEKGKINLNYQILPFSYIQRSTAMHALLKSERMLAIPTTAAREYKNEGGTDYRFPIDAATTLLQAEDRFSAGQFFRTASEFCEIYLVPDAPGAPRDRNTLGAPVGGDYPSMRDFWQAHALTGDNSKERPYTTLYSNLTTRSNRFKVHVQAQTITKSDESDPDTFDPSLDTISDQTATAAFIQRRIVDTPAEQVPGYMLNPDAPRLDFRAVFEIEPITERPFRIINIRDAGTGALQPEIVWTAEIGVDYLIQRSGDLGAWVTIGQVTASETQESFVDDTAEQPDGRVLYRIVRSD